MNKMNSMRCMVICIFIFLSNIIQLVSAQTTFPGTVIAQSPTPLTRTYASPSIVVLPDGTYVVSHDYTGTVSSIYRSTDNGVTWNFTTQVPNCHWATLFVHNNALYLMGTAKSFGNIVIYKSVDGGFSWTTASSSTTGLLFAGRYHTGPVPVVVHNGRIWRAYEESPDPDNERDFHAFVLSAPANADLLDAANWTKSNIMRFDESWLNAKRPNWFEGNIVVTPNGDVIDFMRLETWQAVGGGMPITTGGATGLQRYEVAAKIAVSADGSTISFNNTAAEYAHFPGSESKFTIRYDATSGKYWTIVSKISVFTSTWETYNLPSHQRNVLALYSSSDLVNWEHKYDIIKWNEGYPVKTWDVFGFQYADWQFQGNDIVAVSRTAWYGERYHNANLITFHRIANFRTKQLSDSPADLLPLTQSTPILSWKFSNPDATGSEATSTATFNHANLNVSTLSRGSGLVTTSSLQRSFNSTAPSPATSFANAMTGGQYLQFEVEPKTGYMSSIHSIDVKLRKNSTGATYYKWAYSTDGTNFTEIGDYNIPFTDNNTDGVIQSSIHVGGLAPLQNLSYPQKATFRLVFWGASSSAGGFAIGRYPTADNTPSLVIGGEVKPIPPTPPTLLAWQFSSVAGVVSGSLDANTNNSYLQTSTLSRGAGLIPLSLSRGYYATLTSYGAAGSSANSKETTIANNDYYTFSIKPKTDAVVSLATLNAKLRKNGAGPTMVSWFYSLDGTNFTEIAKSANVLAGDAEGDIQPTVDLSAIPALQNIDDTKTVTFRVYGWGALTNAGGFGIGRYGTGDTTPSLSVGGSVIFNAVELANWNYDLAGKTTPINANIINNNVQQAVLSRGAGAANADNSTYSYVATFAAGATSTTAQSTNAYFQTALTLNSTKQVSLSTIKARLRTSNAKSVKNYKWYYSLDDINYTEIYTGNSTIGFTDTQGEVQPEVNLKSINDLKNLTGGATVYFRMYAWGADVGATTSERGFGFGKGENSTTGRTVLTITGTVTDALAALPVYDLTFSGKANKSTVLLNWATAAEKENSHFEILRSTDGKQFDHLGKLTGSGNTVNRNTYRYTDQNPLLGLNYYQLKQVDFNGNSKRSDLISVDVKLSEHSFTVNAPAQQDIVNLFTKAINGPAVIEIHDIGGRKLLSQKIKLEAGDNHVQLPLLLPKGVYLASLKVEGQPVISNKFIK
ncbi:T9SS type A sorting domain-containing protein [Pedobacter sp. ASV28]|uniref:T9SS type A sorting domain-containing protein n=1 Tax=Pedobacter sp. ASV28 TaxID=2795123 RepID=UPI0018EDB2F9|nr:T9SS type A sorting domain-containing protein [Pedobacter sp. ASV28]